jgi:hypothetical protein
MLQGDMMTDEPISLDFSGVRVYAEGSDRTCISLDPGVTANILDSEFRGGYCGIHIGDVNDGVPIVRVDGRTVKVVACTMLAGSDERAWLRYVKWRERWRATVRWVLWWRR